MADLSFPQEPVSGLGVIVKRVARATAFATRHAFPMVLFLGWLGTHLLYPFDHYYDAGDLYVSPDPAQQGDIRLIYNGGPKIAFTGKYSVVVRTFDGDEVVCDATSAPFPYKPGSTRPDPLGMGWWAPSDPRCAGLPAGVYYIETTWTVVDRGWWGMLPNVSKTIASPPFTVADRVKS